MKRLITGGCTFSFSAELDETLSPDENGTRIRRQVEDAIKAIPGVDIAMNTLNAFVLMPREAIPTIVNGPGDTPHEPSPDDVS